MSARGVRAFGKDRSGAAAVETALVMPVLALCMFAIYQGCLIMAQYLQLTSGVETAARTMANARGVSTFPTSTSCTVSGPYTATKCALLGLAPMLSSTTLTSNLVVKVAGTACTTDAVCTTDLTNAGSGSTVTVSDTYSCNNFQVLQYKLLPGCTLNATTTERLE
jgi:Flp pilus assembly protein TadG